MVKNCLSKESRGLFPLCKIENVVKLFELEIAESEPNVGVLSIILGALEYNLVNTTKNVVPTVADTLSPLSPSTTKTKHNLFQDKKDGSDLKIDPGLSTKTDTADEEVNVETSSGGGSSISPDFPPLELDIVLGLYHKFQMILKTSVNQTLYEQKQNDEKNGKYGTSMDLIKNVSDIVWSSLSKTYNADRPHLQSLYTYLTGKKKGNKLDSFGVALAVVAGAQILDLHDVHLALSEDHAWITFGQNGEFNLEVTWHGKGIEDKRGHPVGLGEDERSWLYLNGSPVKCDRLMEMAAVVTAMNPFISPNIDSLEIGLLQQKLLWILYDAGHLKKYPMAIGTLANLEENSKTSSKESIENLFEEAITSAKIHYKNRHVYPYIYYGGYLFRQQNYKHALKCWADAADVMRDYKYTKNDEDIYSQFYDITKDYLTSIMKESSSGISATSMLRDPTCFTTLLRFIDGICQWEENSDQVKYVIHIGWAKHWSMAIGKFDISIRKAVKILYTKQNENIDQKSIQIGIKETSSIKKLPEQQTDNIDVNGNRKEIGIISQAIKTNNIDEGGMDYTDSVSESSKIIVELTSYKLMEMKDLIQKSKINTSSLVLIFTSQSINTLMDHTSKTNGSGDNTTISSRNRKSKNKPPPDERMMMINEIGKVEITTPIVRPPPKKRARKQ